MFHFFVGAIVDSAFAARTVWRTGHIPSWPTLRAVVAVNLGHFASDSIAERCSAEVEQAGPSNIEARGRR